MADGHDSNLPRAEFKAFTESTQEEWQVIAKNAAEFNKGLADRVLTHLKLLDGDFGGFPVDRLEHSLQTATRAMRGGEDDEYIVCALLHDIGDTLGSHNHPDIAAAILKPFVSEKNHWMVQNHGIFQGYYFFHHLGLDRNMRDQFKDHEWYEYTAKFCHMYDQLAFDPAYESEPLETFEPMVRKLFEKPKKTVYAKPDAAKS